MRLPLLHNWEHTQKTLSKITYNSFLNTKPLLILKQFMTCHKQDVLLSPLPLMWSLPLMRRESHFGKLSSSLVVKRQLFLMVLSAGALLDLICSFFCSWLACYFKWFFFVVFQCHYQNRRVCSCIRISYPHTYHSRAAKLAKCFALTVKGKGDMEVVTRFRSNT